MPETKSFPHRNRLLESPFYFLSTSLVSFITRDFFHGFHVKMYSAFSFNIFIMFKELVIQDYHYKF